MGNNKTSAKAPLSKHQSFLLLKNQEGYALPSVLFLVVLISTIGFTLITFLFLQRQLAISDIDQIQAEYVAESGLNTFLGTTESLPSHGQSREHTFEDGIRSSVELRPWGALFYAVSQGYSHKRSAERVAIIAETPSKDFDNALKYCNPQHGLVLTGTTSIKGSVVVGKAGVSTGSLRDHPTPKVMPIDGKIHKKEYPALPAYKKDVFQGQVQFFEDLLKKRVAPTADFQDQNTVTLTSGKLELNSVKLSTEYIFVDGSAIVSGSINRRGAPLYVVSSGRVSFESGTQVRGLVAFLATDQVNILASTQLQSVIIYSQSSISVGPNPSFSGQLIAPVINVKKGSTLEYPSFVISYQSARPSQEEQYITLDEKSRVEGSVIFLSSGNFELKKESVRISQGATVVGTVYSDGPVTLDGRVVGSVIVKDFYFYEAPTQYLGWLRTAQIDRSILPSGFLVPVGFSEKTRLDVLQWL